MTATILALLAAVGIVTWALNVAWAVVAVLDDEDEDLDGDEAE